MSEIFISHSSVDRVSAAQIATDLRQAGHNIFLDSDREDGIAPGAAWQRTLLRELRICDAVVFLNSSAAQASKWCHAELVIAADLTKQIYPVDLAPDLPRHPLLESVQSIAFESTIDAGIQRLVGELELDGLTASARPRWQRDRPPYPGLAAMDVADAGVFFGREDEVRDLVARVDGPLGRRDGDLVVVMGPSGAGKSSLVRAGLAARLALPHKGWAVASPFEPGLGPLGQLTIRLASLTAGRLTDRECRDKLLTEGLPAFADRLINQLDVPAKRLLITLDQAEQLATVTSAGEREEFLGVLGGGLGSGSPVTVVMTVRSDRFDEVQRLPVIGVAIHSPFVINPLSRDQLAVVIEGPARRADLSFEPGLVGRLIDDVVRGSSGETADALPFLAFVLREMYDLAVNLNRVVFTADDYERVGRIDGAISRRAQAAEASVPPDQERAFERLLPRFVTLSDERLPAAQPVSRELLSDAERPIVERLEDQRLLVGAGGTIRLAHERLITAWPRLAQLVADRRDDLLLQARLERQAADWKNDQGELLGRDATITASSWLTRQAEPTANQSVVGAYIRASQKGLRRRRARFISILSVITALAVATSVVAVVAVVQGSAAIAQRNRALSAAAASYADTLYSSNSPLAAQLSLAAYRLSPTPEALGSVLNATGKILSAQAPTTNIWTNIIAFNSTGSTLETGSADTLQIWHVNPAKPTEPTFWLQEHNPHPNKWIFEIWPDPQDSTMLATIDQDRVYLIDWSGKGQVIPVGIAGSPVPDVLAFSHDGHLLAVGQGDGTVQLWDIENPAHPVPLGAPFADSTGRGTSMTTVAFSSDGSVLATESGPYTSHSLASIGIVRLWNIDHPAAPKLMSADLSSQGPIAFSPVGRTLATIQSDDSLQLWDVADAGHPKATSAPLLGHTSNVLAITFSPDGKTLATASIDYSLRLWNVSNPSQPMATAILGKESNLAYFSSLAFSSNGVLAGTALTYGADKKSTAAQTWLWQTDPKRAAAAICGAASSTQTITRAQWQQVFPGQPYNPPC